MILIISGTNRPNSKTFNIAKCYQQLLNRKSIENEILSLSDLPPNILETDLYGRRSTAFEPIQQKVSDAEMFIFIAPEYNGSIPGALKLFIDCCTFPISFYHKKVALVGLSSGRYGNIRGIDHLTGICHYLIRDTRSFVMSSFPSPYASTVYQAEDTVCFSLSDSTISKR